MPPIEEVFGGICNFTPQDVESKIAEHQDHIKALKKTLLMLKQIDKIEDVQRRSLLETFVKMRGIED